MATLPYDTMSSISQREITDSRRYFCIDLRTRCFILGYMSLVINTLHTLALLAAATYIGISTHGFDHFDSEHPRIISDQVPDVESIEKPFLNQIGILLMVVLCTNVAWLIMNVACLVGLHKKHPGPIRIYVGFASLRLILSLAGLVYLVMTSSINAQTIAAYSTDIILAAYFILVYYQYAVQLEREQNEESELPTTDIAFIYPANFDKQILVA